MKIDITVITNFNGQQFSITAKDIDDDQKTVKETRDYLLNAAVFGINDLNEKLNRPINGSSITQIVKESRKPQIANEEPVVNQVYADEPATSKQISYLRKLGRIFNEENMPTRSEADAMIKKINSNPPTSEDRRTGRRQIIS